VDNRLRFREGLHGIITARFYVSERETWRKIRLTYRQPGEGYRLENYVRARLMRINRHTAETEFVFGTSSESGPSGTDEIESIQSPGSEANAEVTIKDYYFFIEVEMRRWLIVADEHANPSLTMAFSASKTGYGAGGSSELQTPSVPIPPPSGSEVQTIKALLDFPGLDNTLGILTPSPELIGVELSSSIQGF